MWWFIKNKNHIIYYKHNSPMQIHGAILNIVYLAI